MRFGTISWFWPVLWASIGGIVVLVGVLLEVLADKKSFKDIENSRFWDSAGHLGGWLVVLGVLAEVIVGCVTAVNEWRNDPMKRSIASASARVRIVVKTRSNTVPLFVNPDQTQDGINMQLSFCKDGLTNTLLTLESHDITSWRMGTTDKQDCIMRFNEGGTMTDLFDDTWAKRSATTVGQIAEANIVFLHLPDMETNAEVISGVVVLNVNDSTWRFEILDQLTKWGTITTQRTKNGRFLIWPVEILFPKGDGTYLTNWYNGK
ncbi:MAG TPA: hypothetical protein VGO67_14720 [Verrucomicrobiae bacterium]|jgi:hypothetical protein